MWGKSAKKKIYIGRKNDRVCRFCKKGENRTTFKNIAHAIPESLGNKNLILLEECDLCNKKFSEGIEDSLDKFTKPYRTLSQIKGKKKIPSTKSKDKRSLLKVNNKDLEMYSPAESNFLNLDVEKKEVRLSIDREPYIPCDVYKAFMKIAISIIPDSKELDAFKYTILWILDNDSSRHMFTPLKVWTTFIPGHNPIGEVSTMLMRKKNTANTGLPYAILIIGFGNYFFQMYVPSHMGVDNGATVNLSLPFFPSIFESHGKIKPVFDLIDLTGNTKTYDTVPIIVKYSEMTDE